MMKLCIKAYKAEYKSAVTALISDDDFIRTDILSSLEHFPQFGHIVFSEPFHKMRLSIGLESTLSLPSEEDRNAYMKNLKADMVEDQSIYIRIN